jgi:hypothetical protein
VEVTVAAATSCLKRRLYILFIVVYSPSYHQAGAPMIRNLYTVSTKSDMCIYCTHILHNTEMLVGQKK